MKVINCDFADQNFTIDANAKQKSLKYFGISLLRLLNEQQRTNPRKTYWATQKYLKQIFTPLFDDGNLYHIFSDYCESIKQQSKNINLQLKKEFNIDLDPEFKFKFDEKKIKKGTVRDKALHSFEKLLNFQKQLSNVNEQITSS